MNSDPDLRRFLELQLDASRKHRFRTNYVLTIAWLQPSRVHGRTLNFGTHAFTLLLFLAKRLIQSPGDFFPTDDIVLAIEKAHRLLGELNLSWSNPTPGHVHAAIAELRKALRREGLSEALIESSRQRNKGYRLSTPPMNIITDGHGEENLDLLSPDTFRPGNGSVRLAPARLLSRQ